MPICFCISISTLQFSFPLLAAILGWQLLIPLPLLSEVTPLALELDIQDVVGSSHSSILAIHMLLFIVTQFHWQ